MIHHTDLLMNYLLDLMSARSARNLEIIFDDQLSFTEHKITEHQEPFQIKSSSPSKPTD